MKLTRDQVLVVMTVLTWTGVWTFWTGSWAFFGVAFVKSHPFLVDRALRRIVTCLFGAACCWAIKLTLDRLPAKPNGKAISVACALSVAASIGWASINWLVFYGIAPRWGSLALAGSLGVAQTVLCIFLAWAAGYFAVDLDWQARDARLRLAEMKNEAGGARQPSRQQQQIDPHFLFKALDDLSTFIAESKCAAGAV